MNTYPRFVMFDACYNGSFHLPGYVAGYYIFNDGKTIVAQGNSRNVLQDRWTIEMIGLLSQGIRVGQWNRLIATLEGHIIGDPTFRFSVAVPHTLALDIVKIRQTGNYGKNTAGLQYRMYNPWHGGCWPIRMNDTNYLPVC